MALTEERKENRDLNLFELLERVENDLETMIDNFRSVMALGDRLDIEKALERITIARSNVEGNRRL